jgi:hypothetical protein
MEKQSALLLALSRQDIAPDSPLFVRRRRNWGGARRELEPEHRAPLVLHHCWCGCLQTFCYTIKGSPAVTSLRNGVGEAESGLSLSKTPRVLSTQCFTCLSFL